MAIETDLENSNIIILGKTIQKDKNGNPIIKIKLPFSRAFSIQINNPSFRSTYSTVRKNDNWSDISLKEINIVEKEIIKYIKENGSKKQKLELEEYSNSNISVPPLFS